MPRKSQSRGRSPSGACTRSFSARFSGSRAISLRATPAGCEPSRRLSRVEPECPAEQMKTARKRKPLLSLSLCRPLPSTYRHALRPSSTTTNCATKASRFVFCVACRLEHGVRDRGCVQATASPCQQYLCHGSIDRGNTNARRGPKKTPGCSPELLLSAINNKLADRRSWSGYSPLPSFAKRGAIFGRASCSSLWHTRPKRRRKRSPVRNDKAYVNQPVGNRGRSPHVDDQ